jgi:hypothetical protein
MLMLDGTVEALYGFAFLPIYVMEFVLFVDMLLPDHVPHDDVGVYVKSIKETRYKRCTAMFQFTIWLIISILEPLRLSEIDTVPASSSGALVLLWLSIVLIAQHTESRNWVFIQPFTLRSIANYFSVAAAEEIDFAAMLGEVEPATKYDHGSDLQTAEIDEGEFDDQRGTVRGLSVRDSLRDSPPPSEQDLEILEDPPGMNLASTSSVQQSVVGKKSVQIDRAASDREAAGLESMATGGGSLEEEIMK